MLCQLSNDSVGARSMGFVRHVSSRSLGFLDSDFLVGTIWGFEADFFVQTIPVAIVQTICLCGLTVVDLSGQFGNVCSRQSPLSGLFLGLSG